MNVRIDACHLSINSDEQDNIRRETYQLNVLVAWHRSLANLHNLNESISMTIIRFVFIHSFNVFCDTFG
jgi:hypothetical protein